MSNVLPLKKRVTDVLEEIRPMIQADGGDFELVEINQKTGTVILKLMGACSGCFMSEVTLKGGIEKMIKSRIKEIQTVEALSE